MNSNEKHIHLIAVCGVGMAALAGMLKERGFRVSGSDKACYPPMSDFLNSLQIPVVQGFAANNLDHNPDMVIIGNAVSKTNPEVQEVLRRKIPYLSMPEALSRFFLSDRHPIVVAGTHGKTTTSSLISWMLYDAGLDPGFFIGGIAKNFDSNHRSGRGKPFVVEGDEYDTAFFDKGPKFLHYRPRMAVITGVEFDHADIYSSLDQIVANFRRLVALLPEDGLLLAAGGDDRVASILDAARCPVYTYGTRKDDYLSLQNIVKSSGKISGAVYREGKIIGQLDSYLPGTFNLVNALAAAAVLNHLGVSFDRANEALKKFAGVKRRQELRGEVNGVTVIDDFAHHPTAVAATTAAVKDFYANRRLIAVFEPRTNTSRRSFFQSDYPQSFAAADICLIKEIFEPEKIPLNERFSSRKLVEDLKQMGREADYFASTDEIIARLLKISRPQDVVLIMSNGGFDNIHERLMQGLRDKPQG